jgi:RNA polymerase II elongation factor ELL
LTEYIPITSKEQRVQYKREFNTHYNEYIKYHDILRSVKTRFAMLSNQKLQLQRGTPEYKRITQEVLKEYERCSRDQVYQEANQNFHYLHNKMAHIRKLVHDYDTKHRS